MTFSLLSTTFSCTSLEQHAVENPLSCFVVGLCAFRRKQTAGIICILSGDENVVALLAKPGGEIRIMVPLLRKSWGSQYPFGVNNFEEFLRGFLETVLFTWFAMLAFSYLVLLDFNNCFKEMCCAS